jgi:hypothetical protein
MRRDVKLTLSIDNVANDGADAGWEGDNIRDSVETIYGGSNDDVIVAGSKGNSLYGNGGNDRLVGGAGADRLFGVDGDDTFISIGGGQNDQAWGDVGNDSYWMDAESSETLNDPDASFSGGNRVHRVNAFYGGVSRDLNGQDLADPYDAGWTRNYRYNPLFGDGGPTMDDIHQGGTGDCYLLAALSATAKVDPEVIRQSVVDLGDGTYAVNFVDGYGQDVFFRVDADLSYDHSAWSADDGSIWVPILEKAFTYLRDGQGTYGSIDGGWMREGFAALGYGAASVTASDFGNAAGLLNYINGELSAGKAVTFGTWGSASDPLVGRHAYVVDHMVRDSSGRLTGFVARNPWGIDNNNCTDGSDDGYVTVSGAAAFNSLTLVESAWV